MKMRYVLIEKQKISFDDEHKRIWNEKGEGLRRDPSHKMQER
jgi:hypothetical protein